MSNPARRAMIVALFLAVVVTAMAGASPQLEGSETLDPVTLDVIRMLEEGLSSELVTEWLRKTGKLPEDLGAEDLIALKNAGASEELVEHMMDLARAARAGRHAAQMAAPQPSAATQPEPSPTGPVPVEFILDFQPRFVSAVDRAWLLYVYLDGEFLMWSPGGEQTVDLQREMEPGRHIVRLMLERHVMTSAKKKTYEHQAKACLVPVELELKPGSKWVVELSVATGEDRTQGTVGWRILRDGEQVEEASGRGGPFHDWPALCEEILANIPPRKWERSSTRNKLVGCTKWDSVWLGVSSYPTRDQVRKKLQQDNFRPVF